MKTLVFILNYNTPELTDNLYESLKPYERDDYSIYILDNGSDLNKKCKNKVIQLDKNHLFGGGLNIAFKYMLDYAPKYDSLLFMNSDLIVHPYNFVKTLRSYLNEYTIISPSIIQPVKDQCYWKNMHQYGSNTIRQVKWVDFQCPMIHYRFIEHVKQFDSELVYGWGQDVLSGITCEEKGWKVGVLDNITAVHLNSYTINSNKDKPEISNYNRIAEQNMFNYFNRVGLMNKLMEFRNFNEKYSYE
jgi:GT2 family glycosyltransferase